MSQLTAASAATLRAAIVWQSVGQELEAETTVGDLPPEELDAAVETLAAVLEKARKYRDAYRARAEAVRT